MVVLVVWDGLQANVAEWEAQFDGKVTLGSLYQVCRRHPEGLLTRAQQPGFLLLSCSECLSGLAAMFGAIDSDDDDAGWEEVSGEELAEMVRQQEEPPRRRGRVGRVPGA